MGYSSKNYLHNSTDPSSGKSQPRGLKPDLGAGKKRLLYLALSDPDLEVTGATVRIGAFVKHLSQYYDVTLVNMNGSGHQVARQIEDRFRDRNNRLGVKRRVRVNFSRPGYFLISPSLYRHADGLLKRESFDYLLADYGLASVYGKFLSRRHHLPLIYSAHNVEYKMYLALSKHDFRRILLAPYVYWAERSACSDAKLVIAISEHDRGQFAKWIPSERIEVIPQGFDPLTSNPFYEPAAAAHPVILFFGSFRSENNRLAGQRIVEKILPEVLRTRPDAKFQLIGTDPPAELKAPNVECLGFVDDLAPYLRRANLVIAPMPFAQGMSTKIVLAMAFGKTVLATPEAAAGISTKYRTLRVTSLEEFSRKIWELLGERPGVDPGQFSALCDEFAWPNLIARLYSRIEECCAASTPRHTRQSEITGGMPCQ